MTIGYTYQWFRDGREIKSANGRSLTMKQIRAHVALLMDETRREAFPCEPGSFVRNP